MGQFCCEHERQLYMYIAVDVISLFVCCYCFIHFQFVEFVYATLVVHVSCDDTQLTTIFYRTVGVFVP